MPALATLGEALAAKLIDGLPDEALLAVDPCGTILWANSAAGRVLGQGADALPGTHLSALYLDDEARLGLCEQEMREATLRRCVAREGWHPRADGSRFWAYTALTALRGDDGGLLGFSQVIRDMDERVRAEQTLRESEARFAGIIALATDAIVSANEALEIVIFNHAAEETFGYAAAEVLGRPLSMLLPERLRAEHDQLIWQFVASSARARRVGERPLITGLRRNGEEFPAEASISQVEVGAQRLLTAVVRDVSDRIRAEDELRGLLERERLLRARAERSERRARMLAEATRILSDYTAHEEILQGIARLASPELADCCAIHLSEGRHLGAIAFTHGSDPQARALQRAVASRRLPPGIGTVMARAVRTGRLQREQPEPDAAQGVRPRDVLCIPIQARGHTLGLITLCLFRPGSAFSEPDVEIAGELANHVALAIDNAHLYREAEAAKARAERLQVVTAALSEATDAAAIAEAVFRQGAQVVGSHSGLLALASPDGAWLERVHPTGFVPDPLTAWERFPVDATTPVGEAALRGELIALETAEAVCSRYPAVAATMHAMGSGSVVAAPLVARGRVLGALGLGFPEPRRFTPEDRRFFASVGQQCAQALVRAHLLEQEHAARAVAEAALRARDEVLHVVAHDLGNSLSGVLTTSSALLRTLTDPALREGMANIQSAAQQMQRLRRDLLDVAMIDAGQLSVIPAAVSPRELVRDAVAQLRPLAEEKAIRLEARIPGALPRVWADRDRILQVLSNLLVNAVKFTPERGQVVATVGAAGEAVRFSVRDTGPGIAPEYRPHVFNRFWKTQSGNRSGAGLGLAIALGIVEAHRGRLWLQSGEPGGAEFAFTLPLAPAE